MRTRNWSIRSKIIALCTVPLVAFVALWIFATAITAGPAFTLLHANALVTQVGNPGVELVSQLQRERLLSVEYLAGHGPVTKALLEQRAATDRAITDFRQKAGGKAAQQASPPALRDQIQEIFTELDGLGGNRGHIDRREIDAVNALAIFDQVIDSSFRMSDVGSTSTEQSINDELRALTTVGKDVDYLGRVDSLVAGGTAAGLLTDSMRNEMLQDIGVARFLFTQSPNGMTTDEHVQWNQLTTADDYQRIDRMLDQLLQESRAGAAPPVSSAAFRPVYVTVAAKLKQFEDDADADLVRRATPMAVWVLAKLVIAAVLGLFALVLSIFVAVRIGRSIVGRIGRLRAEAQEVADQSLPSVVRRLQRGEAVDVDAETPLLEYGLDEIGQLGNAFNDVRRTAVQSAVDEANVRRGINDVFLNIARRSQTLLHRQLALLDKMERRETEPQELEDLYRVDHLATRMRRHAEDLVILAGAAPGRGWRHPVPVIDVVRGAISEVEDYKRVDIGSLGQPSPPSGPDGGSAILGRAVGDVIHLLAELLENAASFSPPHARVEVGGRLLPGGYAIEIEDRGLGMTPEAIAEANRRLAEPPDFDPSDSARLGLFVVAQLAGRHGIRVSLRSSTYAGVTAVVVIPADLIVAGTGAAALPDGDAWDLPRAGPGPGDPFRRSLIAPQRPGAAEVRELTGSGRPVVLGGTATAEPAAESAWAPRPVAAAPVPSAAAPASSTVAGELSVDGLIQRRRPRRSAPSGPAAPGPIALGPAPAPGPATAGEVAVGPAVRGLRPAVPGSVAPDGPAMEAPTISLPAVDLPAIGLPAVDLPVRRRSAGHRAEADRAVGAGASTQDELPRRVRQASLAPQLRHRPESHPDEETVALRPPEQIRSLMTALQQGTNRGRRDAAKLGWTPPALPAAPEPDWTAPERTGVGPPPGGASFADAATVIFPALVIGTEPSQTEPSQTGPSNGGPSQAGPSQTGPSNGGPSQTGPSNDGPSQTGPTNGGPSHGGPSHGGSDNGGSGDHRTDNVEASKDVRGNASAGDGPADAEPNDVTRPEKDA